jgi:hypothetical protein
VGRLDRAVLHGVDNTEGRHEFAGLVHGDLELAAGGILDRLRKDFRRAVDGVQALWEARRQAPAHGGLGLNAWRCDDRGRGRAGCRTLDE